MSNQTERPRRVLGSLTELGRRELTIEIEMDDEVLVIPMKALTFKEWQEAQRSVPNPTPPPSRVGKNGEPIFDYNDPAYLTQMADATNKRMMLMLIRAIQIEIPGETEDQQIEFLRGLEYGLLDKLAALMAEFNREVNAHINARADSFHPNGTPGESHLPADGLDAEDMELIE